MNMLILLLLSIPAIMIATTLHEFTRAAVSTALGDKLPKEQGRLSLNPMKSFEPIGFLLMITTGFGWGKPVQTSALHYENRKKGVLLTAILPVVVNLVTAVLFMFLAGLTTNYYIMTFFSQLVYYSICLVIYNLVPVTPMDCVKVLSVALPSDKYFKYLQYEKVLQMVFLLLLFMGMTDVLFEPLITGLRMLIYNLVF